ncbi:hypothetical protein FRC06_007684, partial [Ceratobasidium sp. 370]
MPEHHSMCHFKNGITWVSQWMGHELKEMAKVFLPVASNCNAAVIRAAQALLDFTYLVHSSSLTDDDLDDMDVALRIFHKDKEVFVRLKAIKARKFSNIPKLHMMEHYTHLIRWLGMLDGFNTETYEQLHIDFAKAGYRASNRTFLRKCNPQAQRINLASSNVFPVWSHAHLIHAPPPFKPSEGPKLDVLRAQLAMTDQFSQITHPAHFDTALVLKNPDCM